MVGTPLSRWLSVPPTYDGLLLDARKKGGALKKRAADIKIGPVLHASGQHYDGDRVKVVVQVGWKAGRNRCTFSEGMLWLCVLPPPSGDTSVFSPTTGYSCKFSCCDSLSLSRAAAQCPNKLPNTSAHRLSPFFCHSAHPLLSRAGVCEGGHRRLRPADSEADCGEGRQGERGLESAHIAAPW
jgi:hypothetical protein